MNRYCITDSLDVALRAAALGATMIQIRVRSLTTREQLALVRRAVAEAGMPVLVNSRADIALAAGARGVHLRAHSISPEMIRTIAPPAFLVGVSCHTQEELRAAVREGADFAVFGPVFATASHPGAVPLGLDAFSRTVRGVAIPVYAIGGITESNAPLCIEAGAAGIAGISLFIR